MVDGVSVASVMAVGEETSVTALLVVAGMMLETKAFQY
jgi:hypothetical protein